MKWQDLFKNYPRECTKYVMIGMEEMLKAMLVILKVVDNKERFEEILKVTLDSLSKDLEELKNEEETI